MNKTPLQQAISELWQVSRIALASQPTVATRYDRMQYVKKELKARYAPLIEGMTNKAIWFAIEDQLN